MMTLMTGIRETQRGILTAAGTLADAQAEAIAAIGLRGEDAARAMRQERRRRSLVRFECIAARVPGHGPTEDELAQALPWPAPGARPYVHDSGIQRGI